MSYAQDRAWSDAYLPAVKNIVGPHLLTPAPLERDRKEATDLIVLRARDMTIAVRLRRPGFADRYPSQFTIRSRRDSGAKTELQKIAEGWGDWMFYGHATPNLSVCPWYLIDLHMLRAQFIYKPDLLHNPDEIVSGKQANGDGTYFYWFDVTHLNKTVLIARSENAAALSQEAAA